MISLSSSLYTASMNGDDRLVQHHIDNAADVNCPSGPNQMTALHIAAARGHIAVVRLLLNAHANASVYTEDGFTPFYFACQNGHEEVVDEIIATEVDLDLPYGQRNETVLHIAAVNGRSRIVKKLLDRKADLHARTREHFTPLYLASKVGNVDVVRMLIAAGADVEAQNGKQMSTALHTASVNAHVRVVEVLLKHGARVTTESTYCPAVMTIYNRVRLDKEEKELCSLLQRLNSKAALVNQHSFFPFAFIP